MLWSPRDNVLAGNVRRENPAVPAKERSMSKQTITAVFDTRDHAESAALSLRQAGTPAADVTLSPEDARDEVGIRVASAEVVEIWKLGGGRSSAYSGGRRPLGGHRVSG